MTLISEEYRQEQAALHAVGNYGTAALMYGHTVLGLLKSTGARSLLDYGCGSKQSLLQNLNLPIEVVYEGYDPAIPDFSSAPCPAEFVTCIDVLEHIEPHFLDNVLDHLAELADPYGFFTVHTGPALKFLSDGRNAHLTQKGLQWWLPRFQQRFELLTTQTIPNGFAIVVRSLQSDNHLPPPGPLKLPTTTQQPKPPKSPVRTQTSVKYAGFQLTFQTPNAITAQQISTLPSDAPETLQWIADMTPGSLFLDARANTGIFSVLAAVTREAKVFSFEPEAQNFALLNANLSANHLEGQVLAYPLFLSSNIQLGQLLVPKTSAGEAGHCLGMFANLETEDPAALRQGAISTTIDQLIESGAIPTPNYLRIDGNGLQIKVLEGARKALANPALREILVRHQAPSSDQQAIIELLGKCGFSTPSNLQAGDFISPEHPKKTSTLIFKRALEAPPKWVEFTKQFRLAPAPTARGRAVMEYLFQRVADAAVITDPYPYAVIDHVFPEDYYQEILANFPTETSLRPLGETGRVTENAYKERHVVLFTDEELARMSISQQTFWQEFASWMYSDLFLGLFVLKFQRVLGPRFERILAVEPTIKARSDALLVNDHTSYAIGPHTDAPHRLVTFLFYLPHDDSMRELGTSVFRPKDPNFVCWGGPHHNFDAFTKVATVDFLPNRLLTFPKTERSFHGVEKITRENINRPLLINNIRLLNSVTH